jgi:hypothetical protein
LFVTINPFTKTIEHAPAAFGIAGDRVGERRSLERSQHIFHHVPFGEIVQQQFHP